MSLDRALHELTIAEAVELMGIGRILSKLSAVQRTQTAIVQRIGRIEKAMISEGVTMTEIDDKLTGLTNDLGDLADDLNRELVDLRNALSGNLTPDQASKFDSLTAKVDDMKAAIDDADPAAPPAEPTA